jgi:hypothetical protein
MVQEVKVSFAPTRRGGNFVSNEQNNDRDKNRTIRARQRALGRELRRMYDNVAREPIPDEFSDLLSKIDERKDGKS